MSRSQSTDRPQSQSRRSEDWLSQSDDELQRQCRVERFRVSGPGGQHRNKTDSAVRLVHLSTGIVGYASERRSQHQNKAVALQRLRREIALAVRSDVDLTLYHPPPALQRILPRSIAGEVARRDRVGPKHRDFWPGAQRLLDLFAAQEGSLAETAAALGCSSNQLSKLLASESHLWAAANAIREQHGLKPLRR